MIISMFSYLIIEASDMKKLTIKFGEIDELQKVSRLTGITIIMVIVIMFF